MVAAMATAADPAREGSDREITSELVHTAAWDVVLEIVHQRAKALKQRVFNAPTIDETMQARFAHIELKTVVYAVYSKAGEKVPSNVVAIFE